jgi:phosphoribosylpyrophosphate synthetase
MISIKFKDKIQVVSPTKFPDGTTQVWKLQSLSEYQDKEVSVIWNFEEEAELIWINQLLELLWYSKVNIDELYIPYLPYARQDKEITNETTFALRTFFAMIDPHRRAKRISCLDIHSYNLRIISYTPEHYINKAIAESDSNILVFPDKGAYDRYIRLFPDMPFIVLKKNRDQLTGNITGMGIDFDATPQKILNVPVGEALSFLIVDDICDGGATFIGAAKVLHDNFHCDLSLYVTHGIFSKGFKGMQDAGIGKFFTTNSLIQNKEKYGIGYDLIEVR